VIVVALSAGAAIWLSMQNSSNNNGGGQTPEELETHPAVEKGEEADKLATEGNLQGGVDLIDDAIENSSDSHERYILYSEKASLLLNNGKLDEALAAAKLAYEAEQIAGAAALVAQIAEQKGDKPTAIEYYRKAAELTNPEASPLADEEKRHYEQKVAQLEGGQ